MDTIFNGVKSVGWGSRFEVWVKEVVMILFCFFGVGCSFGRCFVFRVLFCVWRGCLGIGQPLLILGTLF